MSVTVSIHSIDNLPVVFRNRGVIYLSKKLMTELNVSPGNFILCQFNDRKRLLKTGLFISGLFNNHRCDALVEKQYGIDGDATLKEITSVDFLTKLEIENINGEEIDDNRLRGIKKYLFDTMFPVNPGCSIYIGNIGHVFSESSSYGIVSNETQMICALSQLRKKYESFEKEQKRLRILFKLRGDELKKRKSKIEDEERKKQSEIEKLESILKNKENEIEEKQGQIKNLEEKIKQLENSINELNRPKTHDSDELSKILG